MSKRKAFAVLVALVMVISLFSPIKLNHLELSAEGEVVDTVVDTTETKNEEETDETIIDEPIDEDPPVNEPDPDEIESEDPVVEQPISEDPITEDPIAEDPVPEDPVLEELPELDQEKNLPDSFEIEGSEDDPEAPEEEEVEPDISLFATGTITLTVAGVETTHETFDEAMAVFMSKNDRGEMVLNGTVYTSEKAFELNHSLTISKGDEVSANPIVNLSGQPYKFQGNADYKIDNVNFNFRGDGATKDGLIYLGQNNPSGNMSLTINNSDFKVDNAGEYGIVMNGHRSETITVNLNNSLLMVTNSKSTGFYTEKAFRYVNLNGSKFISNNNGAGIAVATNQNFWANVKNGSLIQLNDNRGHGINGGHLFVDGSAKAESRGNGTHGMTLMTLTASGEVVSEGNGMTGIHMMSDSTLTGANVQVLKNGAAGGISAGMYLGAKGIGTHRWDANTKITIYGNDGPGLNIDTEFVTVEEGAQVSITHNRAIAKADYSRGGGIYVSRGNVTMPDSAVINNNLAPTAGDDLYVAGGTLTVGPAQGVLESCNHEITGWFMDEAVERWNVHDPSRPVHAVVVAPATFGVGTALKATHGITPTKLEFGFEKVLEGRDWLDTDSFGFSTRLYNVDTPRAPIFNRSTVVSAGSRTRSYEQKITEVGEYILRIQESVRGEAIPRMEYDLTPRIINVSVTYDYELGQLVAEAGDPTEGLIFTNVYTPLPFEFELSFSKELIGREWLDSDVFSFNILGRDEDRNQVYSRSTVIRKGSTDRAYAVSLEKPGVYHFRITEGVRGSEPIPGVEYDTFREFTVTVENDGSLALAGSIEGQYQDLVFTNTYTAAGSFLPVASKELTGRELKEDEFTFVLKQGEEVLQTVTNKAGGTIPFEAINYTQDQLGEYVYTLVELPGSEGGMTYDPLVIEYKVLVSDAGDGTLSIEVEKMPEDTVFNNAYVAENSITIEAMKQLTGRDLKADEFTFNLMLGEEVVRTATNAADGTITFDEIKYTQDDSGQTYIYKLIEVPGDEGGMSYSDNVVTVTVAIQDAGGGVLNVDVEYDSEAEFENTYEATGSFVVEANKVLEGRDLTDDEFTFVLKLGEEVLQTVKNKADGTIPFEPIDYTQDDVGEYIYTLAEIPGTEEGMTYDPLVIEYKVVVSDAGDGKLAIDVDKPEDTVFNNTYVAENSVVIKAMKHLTGRDLKAGEFTFNLMLGEEVISTTTNAIDGTVAFDNIAYTQDDIGEKYTYKMVEMPGTESGMTYADNEVTVTVAIDDAGDGVLDLTVEYESEAVFENTYEAAGMYVIRAKKVLEGRDLIDGEFSFTLTDSEGNVLQTVKNDADGNVTFEALNFTQEDIGKAYIYKVAELTGTHGNMVYDTTVYEVTLTIADATEGVIEVTADKDELEFKNVWQTILVNGTKTWIGGPNAKPVIWFKLQQAVAGSVPVDVPGAPLMKLDGVVEVTWSGLPKYSEAGEAYVYSVREVDASGNPLMLADYTKLEQGMNVTNTYVPPTLPPKTGETSAVPLAGIALLSMAAMIFILKRRPVKR